MRDERRVVSGAAADVQHARAAGERQRVNAGADQTRRAVEQLPLGIDRDGDVVVDVTGIGIGCLPRSTPVIDLRTDQPGARRKKLFPGNIRLHKTGGPEIGCGLDFLSVETAFLLQMHGCWMARSSQITSSGFKTDLAPRSRRTPRRNEVAT